jgi:hypothetical protein
VKWENAVKENAGQTFLTYIPYFEKMKVGL